MNRRDTVVGLMALCVAPLVADAQLKAKVPTVGVVWNAPIAAVKGLEEFILRGLRDLAHVPGTTIIVESYSADGDASRLPALIGDLVRRKRWMSSLRPALRSRRWRTAAPRPSRL